MPKHQPPVHILMPVYNAASYVQKAISSVIQQTYPNLRLVVLDDGSTDHTPDIIASKMRQNPSKVLYYVSKKNCGVAASRNKLLKISKSMNSDAYVGWLDADDQLAHPRVVETIIGQMYKTDSDVCLLNFTMQYETTRQRLNAQGVGSKQERDRLLAEIAERGSVNTFNYEKLLEFTTLGWAKFYAPSMVHHFPQSEACLFEDFVAMAVLLKAKKVTAVVSESIIHLRRDSSVCGHRQPKHFTVDVPVQLARFFVSVLKAHQHDEQLPHLIQQAKRFVIRKIDEYHETLRTNIRFGLTLI